MFLVGVDIGTTGCKAIVFDENGKALGYGFREHNVIQEKFGYAEQNPNEVWKNTKFVLKKAIYESKVKDIKAISISVQGDAIIPVSKGLEPLHNAILGMDYRTTYETGLCEELIGSRRIFDLTGMRSHPMNSLTKIMWFKNNKKELYEKTYKFMTYADFIMSKLGGECVIDFTMASRTMAFDLKNKLWSKEILQKTDITEEKLSKPISSGAIAGMLNEQLRVYLGISKGTMLVTGGHDQTCAALGAGVISENIAIDSHGTAEVLSTAFNLPKINNSMFQSFYPCYLHVKNGMYFTFSLNHTGGILFKWFRDIFGREEIQQAQNSGKDPYELLIEAAPKGPSDILILPHFNGSGTPYCDTNSKGAMLGLTMSTTKGDITKGILDSLTYELKFNIETMNAAGIFIKDIRAVGGAAKSDTWMQIKADILGCTVSTLKIREAACLGSALLAGTATGVYKSLDEGVKSTVKLNKTFEPTNISKLYNEKYEAYKEIYTSIKHINEKI